MAKLARKIFWITIVCLEFPFSFSKNSTWIQSMAVCGIYEERPSTEEDLLKKDTWLGKAKFVLSYGIITLQIQRVEENQISSNCSSTGKQHEFCEREIQLNKNISSFEAIIQNLTSGQKYVIADFNEISTEEIPPPTECLVHRGARHTEYVACNHSFAAGCRKLENSSQIKIIISLDPNNSSGSTDCGPQDIKHNGNSSKKKIIISLNPSNGGGSTDSSCTDCSQQDIKDIASDYSWQSLLEGYKYHLLVLVGGLGTLLIIFDVMCIRWCVRYEVKRKLQSSRGGKIQEISCRPMTEAITSIYRNIDLEGNSPYDLVSNVDGIENASILNKDIDSAHYDKGFFRLLAQGDDYDAACSNNLSTSASPHGDYDLVQKIDKLTTAAVPEEEIYSKQRLDHEDVLEDVSMPPEAKEDDKGSDYRKVTLNAVVVQTRDTIERTAGNKTICVASGKKSSPKLGNNSNKYESKL